MQNEVAVQLQQHGKDLYRVAWRILGQADDVDDVLQDVFLETVRVSHRETVVSWIGLLKRLTVVRSLDRLRKRRFDQNLDEYSVATQLDHPDQRMIAQELEQRLRRELGKLPERQGQVFCLRYFDDLSNKQIALTLDISPPAVATALRKARMRLSKLLLDEQKGART